MTTVEEVQVSKKSLMWTNALWIFVLIFGTVWLIVISRIVFFNPPPAEFISAEISTPLVEAPGPYEKITTQNFVRIKAVIKAPLDPRCLTGTQFFMDFPDGTSIKVPGFRRSTKGDTKTAVYEAAVPRYAPRGSAVFWIRDNYNCGVQARRADSPHLNFIVTEPTNGTDK